MGAGPHGGVHGSPRRERFGSLQWSDNVARMHLFIKEHPEVSVTVPMKNGTDDFIATWTEGGEQAEVKDRSLGWLMDHLEERFRGR
jgi:hypothetical protein